MNKTLKEVLEMIWKGALLGLLAISLAYHVGKGFGEGFSKQSRKVEEETILKALRTAIEEMNEANKISK